MNFFPENGWIEKVMVYMYVPPESVPLELYNE
jgi:hypothetical protein